jgi:hypothetical protein
MDTLGDVVGRSGLVSRLPVKASANQIVPISDYANLPARFDREADREIERRVVCAYDVNGNHPELRRALTVDERSTLERRAVELQRATASPPESTKRKLTDALLGILPQGLDEETSFGIAAAYFETVGKYPPWAIVEACLRIRRGEAKSEPGQTLEQTLNITIRDLVASFSKQLDRTQQLLAAPVAALPARRPTQAEIEAKLGRSLGYPPSGRLASIPPSPGDGKYAQRVAADLERKRAAREVEAQEAIP